MEIQGVVQNGVVVVDGSIVLPEGALVTVLVRTDPVIHVSTNGKRGELPVCRTSAPGTMDLTNEKIQEILDDEEIESIKRTWNESS